MRINFRQGIVSHQAGGFLTLNPSDNVNLLADNAPVTVTIAQANAQTGPRGVDYLHSENNTVVDAWVGPFVTGTDYWLFWDFDTRTFERTFGFTTLEPVAQSVPPGSGNAPVVAVLAGGPGVGSFTVEGNFFRLDNTPFFVINSTGNDSAYTIQSTSFNGLTGETTIVVNETVSDSTPDGDLTLDVDTNGQPLLQDGRHWFDTSENRHFVRIGSTWSERLRVFAAELNNGLTFISQSIASPSSFLGTQIGNTFDTKAGRVVFDETTTAIRRDDGTFLTTEDQFFANASRVDAIRLESNVSFAKIDETAIAKFQIVAYNANGTVRTAQYEDTGATVLGVLTEDRVFGETGSVITQGSVTNPLGFIFSAVGIPLFVDNGILVEEDPHVTNAILHPTAQVPVARPTDTNVIIFEQGLGGVGPAGPAGVAGDLPAATTSLKPLGAVSITTAALDPDCPIAVSATDPRLTDARSPLPHSHPATDITFTAGGDLFAPTVQGALLELDAKKVARAGDTMLGFLTLFADPLDPLHAATKNYVDQRVQGLIWLDPIIFCCLIGDDVSVPPGSPSKGDAYIVDAGGLGAWTGLDDHLVVWNSTTWVDEGLLSAFPVGTRIGISIKSDTVASGTFLGKDNQIAILAVPAAPTWTFEIPVTNNAVFINNASSCFAFAQFAYDGTNWRQFGGAQFAAGKNILISGNLINVKDCILDGGTVDAASICGNDLADLDLRYRLEVDQVPDTDVDVSAKTAAALLSGTPAVADDLAQPAGDTLDNVLQELLDEKAPRQPLYTDFGDLPVAANVPGMFAVVNADRAYFSEGGVWNPIQIFGETITLPYDMAFFFAGTIFQSLTVGSFAITRTVTMTEADVEADSFAVADTASSDVPDFVFEIVQRTPPGAAVVVGTITFSQGVEIGVIDWIADSTLNAGDLLQLRTDGVTAIDSTLQDITVTLVGCADADSC